MARAAVRRRWREEEALSRSEPKEGSIDRSIDGRRTHRGRGAHRRGGQSIGLPLAFICLDSRYRVSILRGIVPGYRTRGRGWVCFLSIRWPIEASRKSRLASWIPRLALNPLLDPRRLRCTPSLLLFGRLPVPPPLCLLFRLGVCSRLLSPRLCALHHTVARAVCPSCAWKIRLVLCDFVG